jgi:hypothetical protein
VGDGVRQVECALVPALGAAAGTADADTPLPRSQDQSASGSGSVCERDHRAVPTYRNSYHRCREPSNGSNLAEVGFLLILFAGVWFVAAQIPAFKIPTERTIVAGIALALGGLLLIIATGLGYFGGPS